MHAPRVTKGSQTLPLRVVTIGEPTAEHGVLCVTMFGVLNMSPTWANSDALVLRNPLALTYIRPLHAAVITEDFALLLETGQAHAPS